MAVYNEIKEKDNQTLYSFFSTSPRGQGRYLFDDEMGSRFYVLVSTGKTYHPSYCLEEIFFNQNPLPLERLSYWGGTFIGELDIIVRNTKNAD